MNGFVIRHCWYCCAWIYLIENCPYKESGFFQVRVSGIQINSSVEIVKHCDCIVIGHGSKYSKCISMLIAHVACHIKHTRRFEVRIWNGWELSHCCCKWNLSETSCKVSKSWRWISFWSGTNVTFQHNF